MAKMGRPSKYRPRFCKMLLDHFNVEAYTVNDMGGVKVNDLPTFEGFAHKIKTTPKRISEWASRHKDFRVAYEQCKATQKSILVTNGLKGHYNSAFAKFVAENCTDMKSVPEMTAQINAVIEIPGLKDIVDNAE